MSRKKKFIRNSIFIAIILIGYFFYNGYFISKEKCLEQLKNALYLQDNIVLEEIQDDENILFVLIDEKDETFSFIRMEEYLNFLYKHRKIGYVGATNELYGELRMKIQKDHSFDYYHTSLDQEAIGDIFLIHRNNPNVHEIELFLDDNSTIRLNDWNNDYIIMVSFLDIYVDSTKTIKAYDINNQLIEEVEYQEFFDHFYDGPLYIW